MTRRYFVLRSPPCRLTGSTSMEKGKNLSPLFSSSTPFRRLSDDALLLPPFSVVRPPFLLPPPTTLAPEKDGMRRGASSFGEECAPPSPSGTVCIGGSFQSPTRTDGKKILMVSKPLDRLSCPRCERAIFLHGILYPSVSMTPDVLFFSLLECRNLRFFVPLLPAF